MHGEYVDHTIVQYTDIYYSDANTYDEDYELTIDSCVRHSVTIQAHEKNLIPYGLVQITEHDVQPKEHDYNSLHPLFFG